jgi:hypothetical protein
MQQSIWRSALAGMAMMIGLSATPSSAAIIYPEEYGLQVASGPIFTISDNLIIRELNNIAIFVDHIYPRFIDLKKDGVIIGDYSELRLNYTTFRDPSTYGFDIFTDTDNGSSTGWRSVGSPIAVRDSKTDDSAIEIIYQIEPYADSIAGYGPATDYVLMRMEFVGLSGGPWGALQSFSAIEKLEALLSFTGGTIIAVDYTITPLEDIPPPPPLWPPSTTDVPLPGSGLLVLSALAGGAILSRRKRGPMPSA